MAKKPKNTRPDSDDIDREYELVRNEIAEGRGRGGQFYTLQNGKNVLRIFKDTHTGKVFHLQKSHWVAWKGKEQGVTCPGRSDCPICALYDVLGDDEKKRAIPRKQFLVNALLVNDDNKHVLVNLSKTLAEEIDENILSTVKGVFDAKVGRNLTISKTGKGFQTKYSVSVSSKPTKVELPESYDLAAFTRPAPPIEELQKIADEIADRHGVDTEKPKAKKAGKKKTKRHSEEEEDEDNN